jgi:hypothetical protein
MLESQQVLAWQMLAKVDTKRRDLMRLLELRFPVPLPEELLSTIKTTNDLGQLSRWFDAAAISPSLDTFRVAVQNGAE